MKPISANFRTSSRMPLLLGEDLIPEPGYALFELVKNAHDADATSVKIILKNIDNPQIGRIIITDNGCGMSLATLTNIWLVLGTAYRRNQGKQYETTPNGRPVLGEKGLGRFAVHKLGERITLTTRTTNQPEYIVNINWKKFDPEDQRFLEEIPVTIRSRSPKRFLNNNTGTRIQISGLREPWTRGMVRDLYRDINSISSPFRSRTDFKTFLEITPHEDWINSLFSYNDAMKIALFKSTATISGVDYSIDYTFSPPESLKDRLESREESLIEKLPPYTPPKTIAKKETPEIPSHLFTQEEISLIKKLGKIEIRMYIYDLDRDIIRETTDDQLGLKRFLKENGGMRVYRNGIRVFGLGGAGEDWLDLGGRRVQVPSSRLSNNQFFGAVFLSSESSELLKEQTNRRGFTESLYLNALRKAIRKILLEVEAYRFSDKERIKAVLSGGITRTPVISDISDLREMLLKKYPDDIKTIEPALNRLEKAYEETRDTLINAASMGLSLGAVVHEVEKQMSLLASAVKKRPFPTEEVQNLVQTLDEMMKGVTFLLRKRSIGVESLNDIVEGLLFTVRHRFRKHQIDLINGFEDHFDIKVRCSRRLVANALLNLIDNSIYWLSIRGHTKKMIYIGPSVDYKQGPAIVIADNGPGFTDTPPDLIRPFFSRKDDGMGLGLYIVDESMRRQEGSLVFPSRGDVDLPNEISGAVTALIFKDKARQ